MSFCGEGACLEIVLTAIRDLARTFLFFTARLSFWQHLQIAKKRKKETLTKFAALAVAEDKARQQEEQELRQKKKQKKQKKWTHLSLMQNS